MERFPKARRIILLLVLTAAAVLGACRGVGMFAFIAVSDPIDESRLPRGTSASKVVQITKEFQTGTKYNYFSSGSTLYRKNMVDRASKSAVWQSVALPSGWTAVQSMAASNDSLLLALARESDGILTVGLFYYSETGGGFRQVQGASFTGSRSGYRTLRVFAPNPDGPFYINVLRHTGSFGQRGATFSGSEMYTLPLYDKVIDWDKSSTKQTGEWTKVLKNRYVSGAASSETEPPAAASNPKATIFSTVNPNKSTDSGRLVYSNGQIVDTKIKRPLSGLTWLPGVKAFIMCTTAASGGTYTVYVNKTTNGIWQSSKLTQIKTSSPFESFLDITGTKGGNGKDGSTKLILAGTRSVGLQQGAGYMEIDVTSPDPAKWTIRTGRSSFTFADTTNYESGALVQSSIASLSLLGGYVYASTNGNGIWSINADGYKGPSSRPKWSPE